MTANDTIIEGLTNNDLDPSVENNYRPIFDGVQVVFNNVERATVDSTAWASNQQYITAYPRSSYNYPVASDYAIIFGAVDEILDTAYWGPAPVPIFERPVPFKGIKLPSGERLPLLVKETMFADDTLNFLDELSFVEMNFPFADFPNFSLSTWIFQFAWDTALVSPTGYPFTAGDTLFLRTIKPLENGDEFTFTAADFSEEVILGDDDLAEIKVVPNPYMVSAQWEQSEYKKRLLFTNLPGSCTIKIYTLSGEYVNKVIHDNPYDDSEEWDLTTINRQEVAPGLYVFAVELEDGRTHIGKFAIIR